MAGYSEEAKELFRKKILAEALGRPRDMVEGHPYCMQDHHVTGQYVRMDGGYLLVRLDDGNSS